MVDITTVDDGTVDATDLAEMMFGDGVQVNSASYSGDPRSIGIFENGKATAENVVPSDAGVILSTGLAESFFNSTGTDPNLRGDTSTDTNGVDRDSAFDALAGAGTFDAAFLDFKIVPSGPVLKLQFVFASDEYPEFSNSIYNDAVGIWLDGVPVPVAVGDGSTSVGNINQLENINLYKSNTGDAFNTEMDGFTVTMALTIPVTPGEEYDLRIGIADQADTVYDSNLLIAADSGQTSLVAMDDEVRIDPGTSKTLAVLNNDSTDSGGVLEITHINGTPVIIGATVELPNGQEVTLNGDGSLTIKADADQEVAPFTYTITDGVNTDTAFVTVSSIPCFTAGSLIRTPQGEQAVETLSIGQLVETQDHGAQPLRWIGRCRVAASGAMAPVEIAANTFGHHRALRVSPQHRILIRSAVSDLLFGEPEVLVAAKHLVNGRTVRQVEGGFVDYVHLLFDAHEVLFSEGLATESFLPGPQSSAIFDAPVLAQIKALLPHIDPATGAGYGPSARRILKPHEVRVLLDAALRAGDEGAAQAA